MTQQPRYRAAVFDFDGTLAEAREAFHECYRYAAESLGLPEPSPDAVARYIGTPVPVAFCELYPDEDPARADDFTAAYARRADDVMVPMTTMLPGVTEAVRKLHADGIKLGIVTQKLRRRIEAMLERDDLVDVFGVVIGGDDMPAFKPDPRGLLLAIERLGETTATTLFAGDTPIDGETAARAGVAFAGVRSGVYSDADFAPYNPIVVLDSVADLPEYLGIA